MEDTWAIGGEGNQYVFRMVRLFGDTEHVERSGLWWDVQVTTGFFRGGYTASTAVCELDELLLDLQRLYDSLKGKASFVNREHEFELRVEMYRGGSVGFEFVSKPSLGLVLKHEFGYDQTFLGETCSALRRVLADVRRRVAAGETYWQGG